MMSLPWEQWDTAVADALMLYPNEKTPTRQEVRAWTHVLTEWKARVMTPHTDSPMKLLREDRPPTDGTASAWWTVLIETGGERWESSICEVIRVCRGEYIETLHWTKSPDEAVRRTEAKWDRQCSAFFPAAFPATVAETLRRIERRLEEVVALRLHAASLLRDVLPTEEAEIARRAAQLYALDELEFERELKWVAQLRGAVEKDAPLPQGTVYSYVDPVTHPEPLPPEDPFDFAGASVPAADPVPKVPGAPQLRVVPTAADDPFDFDRGVTGTKL